MLVFTRREGEEIVIGDPANPIGIIRVADIKSDRVRIALDFPKDVPVHRREVAENIRQEMGMPSAKPVGACCSGAIRGPTIVQVPTRPVS